MQNIDEEKPFPFLPVALILFVIGILLLGGVWVAAQNNAKNPTSLTNTVAEVTHSPSTITATKKLNLETKNATASSQPMLFTFPTKQLLVQIPAEWETTSGANDSHQIVNWWLVDNTVTIQSPDEKASIQTNCPEGGCPDVHGVEIAISDYGANAFTTAQAWYEGKAAKEVTKNASSSGEAQSITTGTFLRLPAYCVSASTVNSVSNPPAGIPAGIFDGTCYVVWKAHVYGVHAALDTTSSNYQSNFAATTTLLKTIKLL